MKRRSYLIFILILIFSGLTLGQKTSHFYNVDKEIRIEGTIQEITMEPRYKNTSPFLIVKLKETKTQQVYNIELSPARFFEQNFYKGEHLEVVGSLYLSGENNLNIIAREVRFRGETLVLRDKHGFPNWRGGSMKKQGRRKGKRF